MAGTAIAKSKNSKIVQSTLWNLQLQVKSLIDLADYRSLFYWHTFSFDLKINQQLKYENEKVQWYKL